MMYYIKEVFYAVGATVLALVAIFALGAIITYTANMLVITLHTNY